MDAGSGFLHDSLPSAPLQEPFTMSTATGAWPCSQTRVSSVQNYEEDNLQSVVDVDDWVGMWPRVVIYGCTNATSVKVEDATGTRLPISTSHTSATQANTRRLPPPPALHPFSARALELFSKQPATSTLRAHIEARPTQTLHDPLERVWQTECRSTKELARLSLLRRFRSPSAPPTGARMLQVYAASAA
jgi:hypothetical protein